MCDARRTTQKCVTQKSAFRPANAPQTPSTNCFPQSPGGHAIRALAVLSVDLVRRTISDRSQRCLVVRCDAVASPSDDQILFPPRFASCPVAYALLECLGNVIRKGNDKQGTHRIRLGDLDGAHDRRWFRCPLDGCWADEPQGRPSRVRSTKSAQSGYAAILVATRARAESSEFRSPGQPVTVKEVSATHAPRSTRHSSQVPAFRFSAA
jgi:hypothetical protein